MGRCFIQIVMGPAGSGKSTYCQAMQYHASTLGASRKRTIHVANLDPAAEDFGYELGVFLKGSVETFVIFSMLKGMRLPRKSNIERVNNHFDKDFIYLLKQTNKHKHTHH